MPILLILKYFTQKEGEFMNINTLEQKLNSFLAIIKVSFLITMNMINLLLLKAKLLT